MKHKQVAILTAVILIGLPAVALANVGTPLIWAHILNLLVGNLCIGILEGALLSKFYQIRTGRAIGLMIVANYFSAWLGWTLLAGVNAEDLGYDLYSAWPLLWELTGVAYLLTLVLEWPFVAGCFAGREKWFRRSCMASLLVQTVSYVLLFGWYGLASGASLFTRMSIVPLDQISLPADVLVYYIADSDGDVYSQDLGTGKIVKVFDLNSTDVEDCLSFAGLEFKSVEKCLKLVALLDSGDMNNPKEIRLGVVVSTDACARTEEDRVKVYARTNSPGSVWGTTSLGPAAESGWKFTAGYWPIAGLRGENSRTDAMMYFSLETPFAQWAVRRAVLLPTDRVIFQLGKRQICILDPETRKIALLAHGRGAVAVLKQPASLDCDD